ncbi:MAG TPA: GyrI-like domain-containing protein [Candidatus Sulfotelmatobacter sp.]|jgi:AraC family transcriptional regulator
MQDDGKDIATVELEMPRFENGRPLLIAGLGGRYSADTLDDLPALWERFSVHIGKVPGQVGRAAYGVCSDMFTGTGSFHYLAGVEVSDSRRLPEGLCLVHMPAQRYVIFSHPGHVSTLRHTVNTIWSQWFPASNHKAARATDGAADFLERYGEDFNPRLGTGDIEVWVPLVG